MFPASTYNGGAVQAFPDVCITPAAPAPTTMPYPNVGAKQSGKASKASKGSKIPVAAKGASRGDLMKSLDDLHSKIKTMQSKDANAWHEAVDDYVLAVAAVFKSGMVVSSQAGPGVRGL